MTVIQCIGTDYSSAGNVHTVHMYKTLHSSTVLINMNCFGYVRCTENVGNLILSKKDAHYAEYNIYKQSIGGNI